MFSNITDAWTNDPVREITNKLSNGAFQNNTNHENMFNFKRQKNNNSDVVSLSENLSLSMVSENTDIPQKKFRSYEPANYDRYPPKKPRRTNTTIESIDIGTDTSTIPDSIKDHRCTHSTHHLKNCDRCYYKFKKMVDDKINKKLDDILLENKIKQLENFSQNTSSSSWKETLIIVAIAIIVILIILLLFKCMGR